MTRITVQGSYKATRSERATGVSTAGFLKGLKRKNILEIHVAVATDHYRDVYKEREKVFNITLTEMKSP